ncbi:Golgin sub A member 7 [Coemansia sp. RSA 2611]|nr:Golgin sub A member 7 [Coemansia sp. RSA 2708]KAJ2309766.1 Golgin sub A member 7 [Coemansia sp. RSA 2705]KAJ2362704.1 Golgin sub A member 7 [Coemansia sp. RSA 2610]KAJ2381017.1 Golgin sub A member 7 [Coemansia sp. RSA 2611]KAJ2730807.1 Golgin sub A member 7 [Coemansia sp. Cherry 401B]
MSNDSSSEHWSFENLTQSSDSGRAQPNDSRKNLSVPLSLVLNPEFSSSTKLATRSPSSGSTRGAYLRRQAARPDSVTSETLSVQYSPQHSSQRLLYAHPSRQSMDPRREPRASAHSDRAMFARSRSPDRSLRAVASASPPPQALATPPPVHARASEAPRARRSPEQDSGPQRAAVPVAKPYAVPAAKSYALPAADAVARPAGDPWRRVRVERDYSQGEVRRFSVAMPEQLAGRLDEQQFKRFVRRLNRMLADAEGATLRSVLEGCLAYATLYVSTLLVKPHFKRAVEHISAFVARENRDVFAPAGLLVIDPLQTAYMFIEIVVL